VSEREIKRIVAAAADADEQEAGDALAALQEHVPVEGALSGEMLAGISIFHLIYGDEVDRARLAATLGRYTPSEITHTAWRLLGRGYEGEPETAPEFAERVAAVIAILYSAGSGEPLDEERVIGTGRQLLPGLVFANG